MDLDILSDLTFQPPLIDFSSSPKLVISNMDL